MCRFSCIRMSHSTSWTMRPKRSSLPIMHDTMKKSRHSVSAKTHYTNCQTRWWSGDDLGLLSGSGSFVVTELNYPFGHSVLKSHVPTKPGPADWVMMHQDNSPKHSCKCTTRHDSESSKVSLSLKCILCAAIGSKKNKQKNRGFITKKGVLQVILREGQEEGLQCKKKKKPENIK